MNPENKPKYLTYSGASVTISINPLHWRLKPWLSRFQDEWAGDNTRTWTVGWLFLTVRFWIDDGCW